MFEEFLTFHSIFDQKANVWLIYVCIDVLSFFNISRHYNISFCDQKANVWPIIVCIHFCKYFNISLHNGISSIGKR